MLTVSVGALLGYFLHNQLLKQQFGKTGAVLATALIGIILSLIPNVEGLGMGMATFGVAKGLTNSISPYFEEK